MEDIQSFIEELRLKFPFSKFRISANGNVQRLRGSKWKEICIHSNSKSTCAKCKLGIEGLESLESVKEQLVRLKNQNPDFQYRLSKCGTFVNRLYKKTWIKLCKHDKAYYQCRECKGSAVCEHDHYRHQCKQCKGSSLCEHERPKGQCTKCKGKHVCKHGSYKYGCLKCGFGDCGHGKRRQECVICEPVKCQECGKIYSKKEHRIHVKIHGNCSSCGIGTPSPSFDHKYCYPCGCHFFGRTPQQKRQDQVFNWLHPQLEDKIGVEEILYDKADPSNDSSTKARADIRIITQHRTIIVEVDEQQHNNENYACLRAKLSNVLGSEIARMSVSERVEDRKKRVREKEYARMNEMASSGDMTHIVFIRFNPDTWKDENGKMHTRKKQVPEERLEMLLEEITQWLDIEKEQEHFAEVVLLYYDGHVRQQDYVEMTPEEYREKHGDFEQDNFDEEDNVFDPFIPDRVSWESEEEDREEPVKKKVKKNPVAKFVFEEDD